jgi:hypothetical protein
MRASNAMGKWAKESFFDPRVRFYEKGLTH